MVSDSDQKLYPVKNYPSISPCGLDCGLCPRYYTQGTSRCPGCCGPDFFLKHPSCSYITCCVKKKGHEVCAECDEFPCVKFKSEEEYQQIEESSSYPSYRKVMQNLISIKENGLEAFIHQQENRMQLLVVMLEDYDDGRSRSFFCRAANLLSIEGIRASLAAVSEQAPTKITPVENEVISKKSKAKSLKNILNDLALRENIKLTVGR